MCLEKQKLLKTVLSVYTFFTVHVYRPYAGIAFGKLLIHIACEFYFINQTKT